MTTQRQKIAALRNRLKRSRSRRRNQTRPAPIKASQQLLTYQQRTIEGGTSLWSWTNRWAGNAASSTHHQSRGGVSKSAATRIEFGGQRTETGCGWKVSANPSFAPK